MKEGDITKDPNVNAFCMCVCVAISNRILIL